MSETRAWTWRHAIIKSGLPPTTRHVLLTISCFMNEMGDGCYPTQKQLADATGLSERAVRQHLDVAEKAGWIKRQEHGFRGQKWRNHEYQACWPEPQDVEKGAAPDAGPSEKGEEPLAGKVRNDVPEGAAPDSAYQSIHQSNNQSTPDARAREGEGDFNILWSEWPAQHRPDHRPTAESIFAKLGAEDQRNARRGAELYRTTMARRGKPARMVTYLRNRLFNEFHDGPEIDKDGDFVIRSDQPEWSVWMGAIRREHGERGVQIAARERYLCRKTRWPDGHQPASA